MTKKHANIKDEFDRLYVEFSQKSPEERAEILIRGFFGTAEQKWNEGDEISGNLAESFHSWFDAPENDQAKNRAIERLAAQA